MYFHNQCGAPDDFMKSLQTALNPIIFLAQEELIPYRKPYAEVIVIKKDPNPRTPDPRYSLATVSSMLQQLMDRIRETNNLENQTEILDKLQILWLHLIGERKTDGMFSPVKLIKEITALFDTEDGPSALMEENENFNFWKKIAELIPLIEYPIDSAGFYIHQDRAIYICYETIRDSVQHQYVNEYGAYVLSHEFFHAFHYQAMEETPKSKRNWSSSSHKLHVRRRAAVESLAEYFAWTYARRYLSLYVQQQGRSVSLLHPFPSWGYAGAELIDKYNEIRHPFRNSCLNPFFKGVFFSSLTNMENGYQLLRKENN